MGGIDTINNREAITYQGAREAEVHFSFRIASFQVKIEIEITVNQGHNLQTRYQMNAENSLNSNDKKDNNLKTILNVQYKMQNQG